MRIMRQETSLLGHLRHPSLTQQYPWATAVPGRTEKASRGSDGNYLRLDTGRGQTYCGKESINSPPTRDRMVFPGTSVSLTTGTREPCLGWWGVASTGFSLQEQLALKVLF